MTVTKGVTVTFREKIGVRFLGSLSHPQTEAAVRTFQKLLDLESVILLQERFHTLRRVFEGRAHPKDPTFRKVEHLTGVGKPFPAFKFERFREPVDARLPVLTQLKSERTVPLCNTYGKEGGQGKAAVGRLIVGGKRSLVTGKNFSVYDQQISPLRLLCDELGKAVGGEITQGISK